jgi:hypothetical protein
MLWPPLDCAPVHLSWYAFYHSMRSMRSWFILPGGMAQKARALDIPQPTTSRGNRAEQNGHDCMIVLHIIKVT